MRKAVRRVAYRCFLYPKRVKSPCQLPFDVLKHNTVSSSLRESAKLHLVKDARNLTTVSCLIEKFPKFFQSQRFRPAVAISLHRLIHTRDPLYFLKDAKDQMSGASVEMHVCGPFLSIACALMKPLRLEA